VQTNCTPPSLKIVNITAWSPYNWDGPIYEVVTEYASVYNCFEKSSIFLYTQQLVTADRWSYILNNDPNGKLGLIKEFEPSGQIGVTETINYNYNNATGEAEGEITIFSEGGVQLVCTNCYALLTLSLQLELDTYWSDFVPQVSYFSVVASGDWKSNVDMELSAEGYWSESGSVEAYDIQLPSIEFFIGWIPVWIEMDVPITINYAAEVAAEMDVKAGFDLEASAEYGIQYEGESGWSPISNEQVTAHAHTPTFSEQVDVTASTFVVPQFNMDLYGIGGPFLNLDPGLVGQFDEDNGQYCVNLGDKLSVNIGAELTWPISKSDSFTLYSISDTLYQECQ